MFKDTLIKLPHVMELRALQKPTVALLTALTFYGIRRFNAMFTGLYPQSHEVRILTLIL
jgi:hypothetical protein